MGHENGGWMNSDQRDSLRERSRPSTAQAATRPCTCTGRCYGPEGLGDGYFCVLSNPANRTAPESDREIDEAWLLENGWSSSGHTGGLLRDLGWCAIKVWPGDAGGVLIVQDRHTIALPGGVPTRSVLLKIIDALGSLS